MRLPLIKQLVSFAKDNDVDFLEETAQTLEALTEVPSLKEEELNVIGEMISNLYGAMEVHAMIGEGTSEKEALNTFMQRVMGAIDN